jgi:pimeloyl-ACP methyl ester carboxylesterase
VFYDTLLKQLNPGEVDAVLAHELGHFKHKHILQRIAMLFGLSLGGLALLGWLSQQVWFYTGLGVQPHLNAPNDALALLLDVHGLQKAVLVGHSLGGLVVQKAIARYPVRAAVLVAPIPARPGAGTLLKIARSHPTDLLRISLGDSLPMRPDYLFHAASQDEAERWAAMCGRESPIAQFEVLLHRPAGPPQGDPPILVIGTPEDALIPIADVRDTARRYGAELLEFPGLGHDLMLDSGGDEVADAMLGWLDARAPSV